jgi:hypothetical protein
MDNLKAESRQKMELFRPVTLGAASRISGMSPTDIGTIWVYLETLQKGPEYRQLHSFVLPLHDNPANNFARWMIIFNSVIVSIFLF